MTKKLTNWIAVIIALLPLAYLAITWSSLPETVPVQFGADMKPDRMGNKSELWASAGILTAVSVFTYFLLKNVQKIDPKRKGANPSAAFHKLAFGIVVFMAALNFLTINMAKESAVSHHLLFPLLGLMFAFIGNYMIHIKPNYFAGIRLPWTLSSDENWRKTHQLGGKLWFSGGLLIAVVCLFLPPSPAFVFFMSITAVMVVIPVVYSYRLYKKQF
jgi:uncharacterized membrane protein